MKVYCRDCKYYCYGDWSDYCNIVIGIDHNYYSPKKRHPKPQIKNKNNNCNDFEPDWWSKLRKWWSQ